MYEFLLQQKKSITVQLNELNDKLTEYPDTNLLCVRNGKYTKWYQSNGTNPIYIPKKERLFAQKLAVKKYYSMQVSHLEHQLNIINKLLASEDETKDNLLSNPAYKELLDSYFTAYPTEVHQWIHSDFVQNTSYPENKIHKTYSGQFVRSKSEVMISNSLFQHKIPFRYECELTLNNITFYPDFTILHPKTMQIFYWEHFGIMDNASYRDSAYNKLKIYGDHNIIPSINLITTYETKDFPTNSRKIEQLIQEFFL